jgi:hypothetical protein
VVVLAADSYRIPPGAPRIRVPDLPIEIASFIDLVALHVSSGGPLVEEEIREREKANPFFSFLTAPWNDPIVVYYRWRLHSLLQGETLLRWSTEPFQVEQGDDKYVWVPPAQIPIGCDALVAAKGAAQQPLSAQWIARVVVDKGGFFVALSSVNAAAWRALLDLSPVSPVQGVLDRAFIGERMVFVIEHRQAATHALAMILDQLALLACQQQQQQQHQEQQQQQSTSSESAQLRSRDPGGEDASARRAFYALSYLFMLNDIGRNANAVVVNDESIPTTDVATPPQKSSTGNSADSGFAVKRGLELISGPVLECLVRIGVNLAGPSRVQTATSALPTDGDGVLPLEAQTGACYDITLRCADPPSSLDTGEGPLDRTAALGMMLLSWTRAVYLEWFDRDVLSRRTRISLEAKYSFILGGEVRIEHLAGLGGK